MNQISTDTIAALSTAPGSAAIAIVRLSGSQAIEIASRIAGKPVGPRAVQLCEFRDAAGERIDRGIVIVFPGPNSYTGEDLVELHCHGGPVITDCLLSAAFALGARPARPGEFTLQAFLNDKLDLTQAEAVADLIGSTSRSAARAALRSLTGAFADHVADLQSRLTSVRTQLEAHLDFPDEEIDPASLASLRAALARIAQAVEHLIERARQGAVLRDGLNVVIAGPPNAGKSSLMNRLSGYDAAIVTELPGTTRDALRETIVVDGLPINIVDTAGLRATDDPIESEGLRRARRELERADHVLWIMDIRDDVNAAIPMAHEQLGEDREFTLIRNKVDLTGQDPQSRLVDGVNCIAISALTGAGVDQLITHLKSVAGLTDEIEGSFSARRRHIDALVAVASHVTESLDALNDSPELAAEELRSAQLALSILTGDFTSDDLLDEIFSTFCIGK